jgi:hypothetical protein
MPMVPSVEPLDLISNNLTEILYHLYQNLKLDAKNEEHKKILIKTRITLRDLEKIKNESHINLLVR